MRLKDHSSDMLPREKFISYGVENLSNAELFAIILQNGTMGNNVVDISSRLLAKYNLKQLSYSSIRELKKIHGIGDVKAMQILSVCELAKRLSFFSPERKIIKNPLDVYCEVASMIINKEKEYFVAIYLDTMKSIIKKEIISIGILDASLVHPRELFRNAIKENAHSIIIAHNHPSGNPNPSESDLKVTDTLINAAKIVGINIVDHIIIAGNSYYSYSSKIINTYDEKFF
jgi:DNA repair protein RadC